MGLGIGMGMNDEPGGGAPVVRTPTFGGGLRIPQNKGVPETEQKSIHERWSTSEDMTAELCDMGLPPAMAPQSGYPGTVTPDQLTTTDNQQYSTLYAERLGWYNYLAEVIADVRSHLLEITNEMQDIWTRIWEAEKKANQSRPPKERFSEKDIEAIIEQNPRHRALKLEQQKYQQKRWSLEAKLESMYRNLQVTSRQVTIRSNEFQGSMVSDNIGTRHRRAGADFPRDTSR